MKRIFLFLAIFAIATTFVFSQSKDEQEIRKLFAATAVAIAKNDVATLSNYYADDLTFTVADGRTVNKTQFLDFVKNSKRESFNFDDVNVRTFGNTAVVNFTRTSTNVNPDGAKVNSKSRDTATLVKNGKGWQIVALQISNELAGNQSGSNSAGGGSSEEQEIRQTLDKIADALTRRDADAMANYWADNHTFTNRNGMITNKAARLASLKSGQPRPGAFKYEDVNIRLLGANTAVVSARPTYPIKFDNGQTITVNDRATMTMAKMNGRWQIVATHSSWDNPETGDNAAVEKQLTEILTNWGNAIGRRDVATIEKILPPNEFMMVSPDGKIGDRTQYLEFIKNLPAEATVAGKATKTMVMGDAAVSTGTYTVTPKGGQAMNYNYTATFIRRQGRWFPAAFHSNAAAQK